MHWPAQERGHVHRVAVLALEGGRRLLRDGSADGREGVHRKRECDTMHCAAMPDATENGYGDSSDGCSETKSGERRG